MDGNGTSWLLREQANSSFANNIAISCEQTDKEGWLCAGGLFLKP